MGYMIAAYAVTVVSVIAYTAYLATERRRLRRRLAAPNDDGAPSSGS